MSRSGVVGRFAPTPSGLLHAGSVVAALGSWLDARAAGGRWLVRIEDLDTPRNAPGAEAGILHQLDRLGLAADGDVVRQSDRGPLFSAALERLRADGHAYPCACSRRERALLAADDEGGPERRYPGTCRTGTGGRPPRSIRLSTAGAGRIDWFDRRLGTQSQDLEAEVGDFVLQRADGIVAYQFAVVVDDAAQGITDVVRGDDLANNTARQIWLQRRLGLPTPRYLHLPLVHAADGRKLSKQTGAAAVEVSTDAAVLAALQAAAATLGLAVSAPTRGEWLERAVRAWHDRWHRPPESPSDSRR